MIIKVEESDCFSNYKSCEFSTTPGRTYETNLELSNMIKSLNNFWLESEKSFAYVWLWFVDELYVGGKIVF